MITLLKLRPYTGDRVAPSPNHGARKAPAIRGIVLHATEDEGNEAQSLTWMRSTKSGVSCHLLVSRAGRVTRLVGDQQRAWHAGRARWRGTRDVNSVTLGIEIANRNDGEPYTDAQYRRVADIVAHYCRQGLSLDDVISHGEIAASRRTDPFGWDWERFRGMVRRQLRAPAAPRRPAAARPPERRPVAEPAAPAADAPPAAARTAQSRTPPPSRASRTSRVARAARGALPKRALHSRTFWLNGATVAAWGGMIAADALDLAHRLWTTPPKDLTKWALFAIGVINLILRWRTRRPLSRDEGAQPAPPPGHETTILADADAARARRSCATTTT